MISFHLFINSVREGFGWLQSPTVGEWYCVGTQVACRMRERIGPSTNWADDYPTTCGGKRHWKVMMERPAERLQQLLTIHGIAAHNCPICDNLHGLWPAQLTGPSHYSTLYHRNDLENSAVRWQWWDLPTSSFPTSLVGRQGPQLCCSELQTLFNLRVSVVVLIILVVLEIAATEIDEPKGTKGNFRTARILPLPSELLCRQLLFSKLLFSESPYSELSWVTLLWATLLWTSLSYSSVSFSEPIYSEVPFREPLDPLLIPQAGRFNFLWL